MRWRWLSAWYTYKEWVFMGCLLVSIVGTTHGIFNHSERFVISGEIGLACCGMWVLYERNL